MSLPLATEKIALPLAWISGASVVAGLINFGTTIYLARAIGTYEFGIYAGVAAAFFLTTAFLSPGCNLYGMKHPDDEAGWSVTWLLTAIQVAVTTVVVLVGSYLFNALSDRNEAHLIILVGILLSAHAISLFANLLYVPLEVSRRHRAIGTIRVVAVAGASLGAIAAHHARIPTNVLVLRDLILSVLLLSLFFAVSPKVRIRVSWNPAAFHRVWAFTRDLWALNALERIAVRVDYAIVGHMLGASSLGAYYAVRGAIEGLLGLALLPIQTVLYSYACRTPTISRPTALLRTYVIVVVFLTIAGLPLAHFLSGKVIGLVFGDQFRSASPVLLPLVIYAVSIAYFETIKVLSMAKGRHGVLSACRLAQCASLVVFAVVLVPHLGLAGAAWSVALSSFVLVMLALQRA